MFLPFTQMLQSWEPNSSIPDPAFEPQSLCSFAAAALKPGGRAFRTWIVDNSSFYRQTGNSKTFPVRVANHEYTVRSMLAGDIASSPGLTLEMHLAVIHPEAIIYAAYSHFTLSSCLQ